jgi:hypothetical protein
MPSDSSIGSHALGFLMRYRSMSYTGEAS